MDKENPKKTNRPASNRPLSARAKAGPSKKDTTGALGQNDNAVHKSKSEVKSVAPTNKPEQPTDKKASDITEMEVHHHPELDHKPKPWKEYLLEGFMIFIAVMMGFIAENIREVINNKEHVQQLTSQLVQDMKADTAELNFIYRSEVKLVKYNDTLFELLQQPLAKVNIRKIQQLIANSHSMWPFHPSEGAIGAIKNELHLKQFSNSKIISYIANYEAHMELLRTVQDITLQYQRSFLDPFLRLHFTPANLNVVFNHTIAPTTQMRNLTQDDLTQLAADMVLIRINTNELVDDNRKLKNDATALLQYVNKQYYPVEE